MNEKPSSINLDYIQKFRVGFNQYMLLNAQRPYETLDKYRAMMWRLGMLVEIWSSIAPSKKVTNNG